MPDRGSHAQLEGRLRSLARSRELWSVHERDPGPGFGESACPRFPGPSRIEVAIRVVASRIDDLLEQYTSIRGCQQPCQPFMKAIVTPWSEPSTMPFEGNGTLYPSLI